MIMVTDPCKTGVLLVHKTDELGTDVSVILGRTEQAELLGVLARMLGYTLVDHEERKSLTELAEEVEELAPAALSSSIARAAEALAAAVASALRSENDKEVTR